MALSRFSNTTSLQNKQILNKLERRPRMLKDLLQEDTNSSTQAAVTTIAQNHSTVKLLRSRSTKATVSALHAIINALKNNIPFAAKSPQSKLSNNVSDNRTVRVKDIIRWKSFRDLAEEISPASDFGCTTATTTTTTTTSGSSWCDSDFTSEYEYLPEDKYLPCVGVGRGCMETTTRMAQDYNIMGPEGDGVCEEKEQCSPLSVLQVDSQFSEGAHLFCSSQKLKFELEEEEEEDDDQVRAMMVLHRRWYQTRNVDDEFDEYENEMAKCWNISGNVLDGNNEACVREMEKGESWSKFDDEQQQLCVQIQEHLLDSMVDDLLIHLF